MSMVYLARHDKLERDVAVKVMLPSHNDDEAFAARFQQEALATARLSHSNIIHSYDFGHRDDLTTWSWNTCPAARSTIGWWRPAPRASGWIWPRRCTS
jgi:serine/threonine protein kinase